MKRNRVICSLAVLAATAMSCWKPDDMPGVTVDYSVGEKRTYEELYSYHSLFGDIRESDFQFITFTYKETQEDYVEFDISSVFPMFAVSIVSPGHFFENGVEYSLAEDIGYSPARYLILAMDDKGNNVKVSKGDDMYVSGWLKFVKVEDEKIRFSVHFEGEFAKLCDWDSQGHPLYFEHPDTIGFHGRIDFHEKLFAKSQNKDYGYSSCLK